MKTAVAARFPDSKAKITYASEDDPEPRGHVLVFQNIFSSFQIWQKDSEGASDAFKKAGSVRHSSLTAKVSEGWWSPLTLVWEGRVGGVLSPSCGR